MSSYREQSLKAKAAREGIVEQRASPGKNKKPRPIIVELRMKTKDPMARFFTNSHKWRKCGAYRNEAEARAAMDQQSRKYSFYEYRLKPAKGDAA